MYSLKVHRKINWQLHHSDPVSSLLRSEDGSRTGDWYTSFVADSKIYVFTSETSLTVQFPECHNGKMR